MDFLETILVQKAKEVAQLPDVELQEMPKRPSFYEIVLNQPEKMHVIGEIKRASPSKGDINTEVDILAQAKTYQAAGVSAISVLTDEVFFKGKIEDLRQIAQVVDAPLLCKDFIVSKKQLIRAKNAGASLVLLIVAALEQENLQKLYQTATDLGLEVLVETHDQEELTRAQAIGAKIIGVNNRNLKTFEVAIATSVALAPEKSATIYISESGFKTGADVLRVTKNYHGVLVGETLMRASDAAEKIQELRVHR
ncbi:MAG: indole-3-glycerol phosphate synthase TrpC [Enterococcus sp.]